MLKLLGQTYSGPYHKKGWKMQSDFDRDEMRLNWIQPEQMGVYKQRQINVSG